MRQWFIVCGIILTSFVSGCGPVDADDPTLGMEEYAACTELDPGTLGCAGETIATAYIKNEVGAIIGVVELRAATATSGQCKGARWSRVSSRVGDANMSAWLKDSAGVKVPCTNDSYFGQQMWSFIGYDTSARACGYMKYYDPNSGIFRTGSKCTS